MAGEPRRGGKKGRKIGRAAKKPKNAKYKNNNQRAKNKVRRVFKSNGEAAAKKYAAANGVASYLDKRLRRGSWNFI